MLEKIDYYDALGVLLPGTLMVAWVPICFPTILLIRVPEYPDLFVGLVLVALAIVVGQLVQAIASMLEPLLWATWGGMHSHRAMKGQLPRCLPTAEVERIKVRLAAYARGNTSDGALFRCAMQLADGAAVGRVAKFNALYAYHRNLAATGFLCLALFIASAAFHGAAAGLSRGMVIAGTAAAVAVTAILWNRARQRSMYYVTEVLMTAENVLSCRETPAAGQP